MGTWGSGLFASDSAQDFLDGLLDDAMAARLDRIRSVLETTAGDPAVIMREYVPEEIVVAAAITAATLAREPRPRWMGDEPLRSITSEMPPQNSLARPAGIALQAAMDYNDSWLVASMKDEGDRQSLSRDLLELKAILDNNASLGN